MRAEDWGQVDLPIVGGHPAADERTAFSPTRDHDVRAPRNPCDRHHQWRGVTRAVTRQDNVVPMIGRCVHAHPREREDKLAGGRDRPGEREVPGIRSRCATSRLPAAFSVTRTCTVVPAGTAYDARDGEGHRLGLRLAAVLGSLARCYRKDRRSSFALVRGADDAPGCTAGPPRRCTPASPWRSAPSSR